MNTCAILSLSILGLALSLPACVADTTPEEDPADSQSAALTQGHGRALVNRLAFGSMASGDQGPASSADLIEVQNWVMSDGLSWNDQNEMLSLGHQGKIPYVYFYIAAGLAKKALHIDDCNVTDFNDSLCKWGGDYIWKNTQAVVNAHAAAAQQVQKAVGNHPALVHVEPDWYQYSQPTQGAMHQLSVKESGQILTEIVSAIHTHCSSCKVVLDVSPWHPDLKAYFSHVDLSHVSYVGLVGKLFPGTDISAHKIDNYSYADIHGITGKRVIVNTAHGPGGPVLPYDTTWDGVHTLNAAWKAGVGGLIQGNKSTAHYQQQITAYEKQ